MKKNIKKLFSVVLVLSLLFSVVSISVYAADMEKATVTVINEWDEYQKLVSMDNNELKESGYSEQQIAEIRDFDYEEEIRKRAELDDKTLKAYGYTDSEIDELRQVAKMDEIPNSVMKTISTSTLTTELRYMSSGSRTEASKPMYYVNMKFSWKWNRAPLNKMIDAVAIGFNTSTSDAFTYCDVSSNKVYVKYDSILDSSTKTKTFTWDYSTSKSNSFSVDFDVDLVDKTNSTTHIAFSGYGTFQLTNRSNKARLYIDACYGHKIIVGRPTYSVNLSGASVGVSFGIGVDEQHCTGWFYEDFTIASSYIYHGNVIGKK